ncbi:FAD-dependent oxidoreductase [Hydrogenophaga sp. 5NK40-0174]|uniref:FAD-dependent oxidoreductase n=1 Tax=Hydrogenophaga sp. 5NK40-0174 TaxID=3127649 RepID=UPI00310B6838
MGTYTYPRFKYRGPADLMVDAPQRRPLVIIGAGPVGLAAAIDARLRGLDVLLFDEEDSVSFGSRAVCYAKRALEILDRLGVGEPIRAKGVSWNVGRTFVKEEEVYHFNLVPEPGHQWPGMINLQQYHLEEALVHRAIDVGADIRWNHRVTHVEPAADGARVSVTTPDGDFDIDADWVIVADGARSPIRRQLGLDIEGHVFKDRFLIADVIMKADFPAERWFWFDPPFHPRQSVLLHKQSDNVWRIDFQLGWEADPEEEKKPENIIPRVQAMLGKDRPFELEWASIYTFQCRRMKNFRHGRLLFAGDAAHQVSPFGARGANSGIQDTDDLIWKLALVMKGEAPDALLDTYDVDRAYAADENIRNSTRSTDFITPKSEVSRLFRNAALQLARTQPFARKLVNSGRLSVPAFLVGSALNTSDQDGFHGDMVPGAAIADAPIRRDGQDSWLLGQLGQGFTLLAYELTEAEATGLRQSLAAMTPGVELLTVGAGEHNDIADVQGMVKLRLDAQERTCYLVRPDQIVAARWRTPDLGGVEKALAQAVGKNLSAVASAEMTTA